MRKVLRDFDIGGYRIKAGKFVCAAPAVTHRIAEIFPNPEQFDPDRYTAERAEDRNLYGWQAFGGGRHKCSGNAFALFQIKAIFCVLLRRYEFELVDAPSSYRDDYTKMVVEPASPCRIRYRKRAQAQSGRSMSEDQGAPEAEELKTLGRFRIEVDFDLCKGHATCMGEAPELFKVDEEGRLTILEDTPEELFREKALKAAKYCPTQAIKVSDT